MAATTGLGEPSRRPRTSERPGSRGGLPNSVMSAPAMNVRPAQGRTIAWTWAPATPWFIPSRSPCRTPWLSALTGGLLTVSTATRPRRSRSTNWVMAGMKRSSGFGFVSAHDTPRPTFPSRPRASSRLLRRRIHQDEAVAIRHLHPRERLGVHLVALADDPVLLQEIGGDGVHLVVGHRLGLDVRHGATHVIEDRGRVRPVASDRAYGRLAGQRALTAHQTVVGLAGPLGPVAGQALLLVHGRASDGVPAAGR